MPKISVIVPVYNVEKYLSRCIDSILNQTFTDFELILVDDGSTDRSGIICDKYAQKDSRLQVIHKKNGGPGAARNTGIDWAFNNSDSEWVCFVDSDDYIHSKYFELLYNLAKDNKKELVVCSFIETEYELIESEVRVSAVLYNAEEFYCERLKYLSGPWAKLLKKDLFFDIRFPNESVGEDAYIMYQLLFKAKSLVFTDCELYYYFQSKDSLIRSSWTPKKLFALEAFKNQIQFFKQNGYYNAYIRAIRAYAYTLYNQILECQRSQEFVLELKRMKNQLRLHLRKYKKECNFSIQNYPEFYSLLCPKISFVYWTVKGLKNRI